MKFNGIGVFKFNFENPNKVQKFEERVVTTHAFSLEEAENAILTEFEEYATDDTEFTGIYEINKLYEDINDKVVEVASTMRVFSGTDEEYLEQYWNDNKPLSCDIVGWKHVWFNRGEGKSGCYNFQEERNGELWKDV